MAELAGAGGRAPPPWYLIFFFGALAALGPLSIDVYLPAIPSIAADFDVTSFGVVVRNFTNETADAWTTQDWSTYEGIGFWMYGNGSGTDLFLDLLDNRNPGSTTDDAERFVLIDLEVEAVVHNLAAEAVGHVLELDQRAHG